MIMPIDTIRKSFSLRRFLITNLTTSATATPTAGANKNVKKPIKRVSQLPASEMITAIRKAHTKSSGLAVLKTFCCFRTQSWQR